MVPDTPPTAEGDLESTPFPHLAVYAVDRRLTGELFLEESADVVHAVRFERGVPVKIRMGDGYARLGELLVEEELVSQEDVDGAALTGGLLGDVLVLAGYVESSALNAVLERQFLLRYQHLFELPSTTPYKYFEGSETLKDYGGEPASFDPLALLWQGIREHGEKSVFFEPTLEKLHGVTLKLHAQACPLRFDLEEDALLVSEIIGLEPTPVSELLDIEGVSPDIVNKFLYLMAITRQFDVGRGTMPVGSEERRSSSLAKVRLKSQVHRVGVAVDAPGDGERSVRVSVRGRAVIPRGEEEEVAMSTRVASADELQNAAPSVAEAASAEAAVAEGEAAAAEAPVERPATDTAETKPPPPATAKNGAASKPDADDEHAELSSRRLVADTIRALPIPALLQLARDKIDEKEATMAVEVCAFAIQKLEESVRLTSSEGVEAIALHAWARALEPHPDLKSLTVELDEQIRARDDIALPRYVRGLLRKRLGNEAGATSDFKRVLEIEPANALARAELEGQATAIKRGETGFLKKLFRR